MCGIAGIINFDKPTVSLETLQRMVRTLQHRGPDEEGFYLKAPMAMGMRRLSIIDLDSGKQPIQNEDGSIHVIFNGEIYNHQEIRNELLQKGHVFTTKTDTEAIVHAYEEYGESFLQRLNGMYAIAIWDTRKQHLLLARDRLGIKPLYYGLHEGTLVFGSEIKALLEAHALPLELNHHAVQAFFALRYIPAPLSIYNSIYKLPAAHFLKFSRHDGLHLDCYWDVEYSNINEYSEKHYQEQFLELLDNSVEAQMLADVPLGAFLSGGLDSSAIAYSMAKQSDARPQTFTIGYTESYYDERHHARQVAKQIKTEHQELVAAPNILKFLDNYSWYFDEPFADAAALPTYLLSQFARKNVKVALSGDGGDEIFAGYTRYQSEQLADLYSMIPAPIRKRLLNPVISSMAKATPPNIRLRNWLDDAEKKANLSFLPPTERYISHFNSFWDVADNKLWTRDTLPLFGTAHASDHLSVFMQQKGECDPLNRRLYTDMKTWLAEMMLTKVDRMSMAASLEVRVPLLDHRIVEFAAKLPVKYKMSLNCTKRFFKQAMSERLPKSIVYRQKHGFQVPLDSWFRNELKEMVCDSLARDRIESVGIINADFVEQLLNEHMSERKNHSEKIFSLLVFFLWHERWL
jgi:asparagine synthase (glutamine-hydrolysing)